MDNEQSVEKKRVKRKKYKRMKTVLIVMIPICILAITASVYFGINLFATQKALSENSNLLKSAEYKCSELESSAEQLTAEYELLKSENESFYSENNRLTAENFQLLNELEELRNNLTWNGESIAELENKITQKDNTISSLETKIKNLNKNISELETQLKELRSTQSNNSKEPNNAEEQPTTETKYAYLTFDDGVSIYTNTILDILKQYNVKATFFVNWKPGVSGYEDLYKRIVNEGHTIANHTKSHEWSDVYSTVDEFRNEVQFLHDKIKEITGYEMTLFRFPGGSNNTIHKKYMKEQLFPDILTLVHSLGYEYFDWNVDSGDADYNGVPSKTIVNNVLNGATGNKAIILMHDTAYKKTTVEALPEIIEGLIDKGYTLKSLDENVVPRQFAADPKQQ